ncbi:MAG: UDP-N-acetylmuramyl-tripeptide synthetase, partial [Actinobacteria bacterium]|nr:UDP-N-acetylmuramyl-tripeptide synthetase [Actinomycetota bacterium]
MRLTDLAAALAAPGGSHGRAPSTTGPSDEVEVEVTGVTHQADWVQPGEAFVAIPGARFDGHSFIEQAVARGAVAVLGEGLPEGVDCPVPYVVVPAARPALADAAAAIAGHPSRAMTVLGVTGTDGKTTTSCLARHLLRAAGRRTGLLSTIGYELPDGQLRQPPAHFTTPEAPQVQQILADLRAADAEVVVIETSSHALALDRVRAVDYDVAVWTNLTGEHLDFHGTMEGYFAAKALLVQRARVAVLNADDDWTPRLVELSTGGHTTYSAEGCGADWTASAVVEGPDDLRFTVHGPQGSAQAVLPMIGRFNVANALAAMAGAHRAGVGMEALIDGLASFAGVPGRMEMVERGEGD